jgi:hypothetical protein
LTFFGLTPEYRLYLFSQIHEIVFHGNGGYDWDTIYNMPIWLRKFTFNKIKEYYDKQNEEAEKQQNMLKNNSSKELARPNINPTYTTKAPKK